MVWLRRLLYLTVAHAVVLRLPAGLLPGFLKDFVEPALWGPMQVLFALVLSGRRVRLCAVAAALAASAALVENWLLPLAIAAMSPHAPSLFPGEPSLFPGTPSRAGLRPGSGRHRPRGTPGRRLPRPVGRKDRLSMKQAFYLHCSSMAALSAEVTGRSYLSATWAKRTA
ncbi:hypothetical protein [Microbispora sp. NPDC049633]|uniref:hypothetical protein n=1 Tax=Microbispora sp. NPDC049633 TaxID=3154355 RepID=UPI003444BFCA